MQSQVSDNGNQKNHVAILKFTILSILGVIVFFVKIEIDGNKSVILDHIISLIRPFMADKYPILILLFGLFTIFEVWVKKSFFQMNRVNKILAIMSTIGGIIAAMVLFRIGPAWLISDDIAVFAVDISGIGSVTMVVAGIFLSLLLDFGLVEATGVLLRSVMRPLYNLPGRSSVIGLTGFLGNFSVGHIATSRMYREGKFTKKEAAIIALAVATPSVGIMILCTSLLGLMEYWNTVFLTATIIYFLISFIMVRIYPLKQIKNEYYDGVTPQPENDNQKVSLRQAWVIGIQTASQSGSIMKNIAKTTLIAVRATARVMTMAIIIQVAALLLYKYTDVFSLLGYPFSPLLKLMGFQNIDVLSEVIGMQFIDFFTSVNIAAHADLTIQARFFVACMIMTVTIFVSGFWTMIYSTELPVKTVHLFITWLIRMILSIIFIGIAAVLIF